MKTLHYNHPFTLENGQTLSGIDIAYHCFGTLNRKKTNVVWVCHALTADSDVCRWWAGLFGEGCLFDPSNYFIVCANNLGSCYGTTGPVSHNKSTGQPLFSAFPHITIRDMVKAHELLRAHLGIEKIAIVIGGSQGGQQVLEWNVQQPELFEQVVVLATNAHHSAWGIAFNESQRLAIKADRTYYAHLPNGGEKGLAAARSVALLSYRHYSCYNHAQSEPDQEKTNDLRAASYQRYQGQKLAARFNAYSYVTLLNAMDSHHLARGRENLETALKRITARCLVIGISSDLLFPPQEQLFIARHIADSELNIIESIYGHDGFLTETAQISRLISAFLNKPARTSEETSHLLNTLNYL